PVAGDADMQRERAVAILAVGSEQVLLDEIVDRDRAFMLDVRPGTPDRFLVERHADDAIVGIIALGIAVGGRLGHVRLRRIPTDREWAPGPSPWRSVIAAGQSARNCSGPHLRIDARFMKSSTPGREENRAERAVGST